MSSYDKLYMSFIYKSSYDRLYVSCMIYMSSYDRLYMSFICIYPRGDYTCHTSTCHLMIDSLPFIAHAHTHT